MHPAAAADSSAEGGAGGPGRGMALAPLLPTGRRWQLPDSSHKAGVGIVALDRAGADTAAILEVFLLQQYFFAVPKSGMFVFFGASCAQRKLTAWAAHIQAACFPSTPRAPNAWFDMQLLRLFSHASDRKITGTGAPAVHRACQWQQESYVPVPSRLTPSMRFVRSFCRGHEHHL